MFKRILTYSILTLIALGGFFGNIVTQKGINTDSVISMSYETNTTYAASGDTTPSEQVKAYNSIITNINIVLAVLSAMITPIILFVGWLMSPDWTSGDLFGLRTPMYALWVTVSNIVYFIYAILLILIALGTMFGQDKFSYKVMLPKLALGILMVPFTWWFVQWTISIASVVTASVMTIPAETIAKGDSKWFTENSIPMNISIDNTGTGSKSEPSVCPGACISPKKFLEKSGGMYGPLIVYGYSIFKFKEIQKLDSGVDIASAALQIVHTSIISTIMFAVFGLLTLALASMLLVRAMKLWMYAIFAPLFTFRFVAGSNLMGGDDDSFSIKEFIGLAFVPAIVGLTLSFGLIIINAVQGPASPSPGAPVGQTCNLEAEGCTILNIMGSADNTILRKIKTDEDTGKKYSLTMFKYGEVTFTFKGKASNQTNTSSTASGAIDALGGMFGTLIVDVLALVFIWMAFMAAKNVSKAVKIAVEPFEKIGTQVGTLAKSLPKYTPLPLPGGSISGMSKVTDGLSRLPEVRANERFEKSGVGKWIKDQTNGASVAETQKLREAITSSPENIRNAVKMSKEGFQNEGIKTILANEEALKKNLTAGKYNSSEQAEILKLIEMAKKDGKLDINDSMRLQAILSGAKANITKTEAENIIKGFKTGESSGSTGINTSTSIKIDVNGGDKFTFSGSGFELKDQTKDSILAELKKAPANLKSMSDLEITEALKKMHASDSEITDLIKKVEDERKKL